MIAHWVAELVSAEAPSQRRSIAKAITLLESTLARDRAQADALLTALMPHSGKALRLGISGVPGVGKSTFIEALGLFLIERGHRVAVLAVDPSSSVSGGSILGDKTRMERLSVHEKAFIRPSPSRGNLGGVAAHTREAMVVLEAAGYDMVLVETVGVGQSEVTVAGMTDMFVLMQLPNAGDDLQAMKKGVMELADLVLINKADLDPDAATRAQAQIASSLRVRGYGGAHTQQQLPLVFPICAPKADGLVAMWGAVMAFEARQRETGEWLLKRQAQASSWLEERLETGLRTAFERHAAVSAQLRQLREAVAGGEIAATVAARQLLALFAGGAT